MSTQADKDDAQPILPLLVDLAGVSCAISTRHGGISQPPYASLNLGRSTRDEASALAHNRRVFADAAGFELDQAARIHQVHGSRVVPVTRPGSFGRADGLVTARAGLALVITVADCLPVFLYDPAAGIIGAVHAGWRGILLGVLEQAVESAVALGARPSGLQVAIGPSIGPCCFEVGPEVAGRFPGSLRQAEGGRQHVDLRQAAARRLQASGVPETGIRLPAHCTRCHTRLFFSARSGEPTGRMAGMIIRRHEPAA